MPAITSAAEVANENVAAEAPAAEPKKAVRAAANRNGGKGKPAPKAAASKAKPDKAVAKKTAAKPAASVQGTERDHDLPWNAKKVALFKTLKQLKAFGATNARGSKDIVEKAGDALSPRDVRHYSYHAKAAGLIDLADVEGVVGYGYYLTAKGQKIDPAAELKAQEAAKKAK